MSVDPLFEKKGMKARSRMAEAEELARKIHPGTVDFSAFVQARDRRFLGFQGELYVGRPCGNDSSNVCAMTNAPQYWKRYYYKGEALKDVFDEADTVALKRYGRKNEPVDLSGVFKLAESLREDVLVAEKPKEVTGRPVTFHTVLNGKYTDALGRQVDPSAKPYQYCRNAHRSTKSELHFIASTMFRKDRDLILDRAEALKKTSSLKTNFGDLMMPPTKEQMSKPGGAASNSD